MAYLAWATYMENVFIVELLFVIEILYFLRKRSILINDGFSYSENV
jgi:hypothetical protein